MSAPLNSQRTPDYAALPELLPWTRRGPRDLTSGDLGACWSRATTTSRSSSTHADDYELTEDQLTTAFCRIALRRDRVSRPRSATSGRARTRPRGAQRQRRDRLSGISRAAEPASAEIGDERDDSRHWSGFVHFRCCGH